MFKYLIAATLMMAAAGQSVAFFVLDAQSAVFAPGIEKKDWVPITNVDRGLLVERGQGEGQVVPGMGRSVPLMSVFKMVVPSDWTIFKQTGLSTRRRVSWRGNKPWPKILAALAKETNYRITLDWERRYLFVESAPRPAWISDTRYP